MSGKIAVRYRLQRSDFSLNVDAEIPMRGITGVFGESGAGKTALLRCIAGLEQAAAIRAERGLSFHLEVDGGIDADTAPTAVRAGESLF